MNGVRCFMLTPTDRCSVSFWRFTFGDRTRCAAGGSGCNASVTIGEEALPPGSGGRGDRPDEATKADPRWPRACERCGREFAPEDEWQVNHDVLYARSDGGPPTTLRAAPAGAMWDAHWMGDWCGPDGLHLCVRLPDGSDWMIDGPSYNADRSRQSNTGWQRTGTPPNITARPSILIHGTGYHAFLTDGVLVPC